MQMRALLPIVIGAVALASCGEETVEDGMATIVTTPDPIVARALNDPLMTDPDLVLRNEGNSVLSIRHDHALPPHFATTETAEAAREAGTRQLLETGQMVDLPLSSGAANGEALALGMTATEVIKATGAPSRCLGKLEEGLIWAARLPDAAQVMPHGMTMQAAGADTDRCKIRIVRYVTPAKIEDALRYHFNRADRTGMSAKRYKVPEDILDAERGSEHLKVYARPGPGGTNAIDLIYWKR